MVERLDMQRDVELVVLWGLLWVDLLVVWMAAQ